MGPEQKKIPIALAYALLSDGGRILFLKQKDRFGVERIGLPSVWIEKDQDPVKRLTEAFLKQTGIDGQVHEAKSQSTHNIGSRKKKKFIPVLCFTVTAKSAQAKPSPEFSGYAWLSIDDAKKRKVSRTCEWLYKLGGT